MVDRVHPAQQVGEQVPVADVALVEVDLGAQVGGLAPVPVHWLGERVQHHDVMAEAEQPVAGVRPDEAGAPGDKNLHCLRCLFGSPRPRGRHPGSAPPSPPR